MNKKEGLRLDSAALSKLMMQKSNDIDQIDHNGTNNFMDNSLQQVVSSLNDGVPSDNENMVEELLNAESNSYQDRRRGAQR